jgi:AraC family transcriptional activator of pobA
MKWMFHERITNGKFILASHEPALKGQGALHDKSEHVNTIVFNPGAQQQVTVDGITYTMPANCLLPLVANQHFVFERPEGLIAWQFNRDFYCIAQHDAEVGCVGFLFYGIEQSLFIPLTQDEADSLLTIEKLCLEDMMETDKMQGEMLRTLLKRIIIKATRTAKKHSTLYANCGEEKMDIVRAFNLLLEINYRSQHEVSFYAGAMNRSPKTLCNIFALIGCPPPSKLIQQRIMLEAKRYLYYTTKTAKEIADLLGFINTTHFSRFFKKNSGIMFSKFRA